MSNFPSDFTLGDPDAKVIGSGLLQPSINAQVRQPQPTLPVASELQASQSPKLASPTPSTNATWFEEGYNYNAKNEGMIPHVYLDYAAVKPSLEKMKEDKRWAQDSKGKWGMKTAGTGYTTDKDGKPWDSSMIGKVVTNEKEDRERYTKDAAVWDADMAKRFPELWAIGSDKNKATLKSLYHNVGSAYFKDGSKSDLYKQMKEGNWNAIAFNARSWAWKKGPDGKFLKDKNGKIISNNPKLESRRERDESRLHDEN